MFSIFRRKPSVVETIEGLIHNAYVPREWHNHRVRELLDANNREVERRREMQREWELCERQALRAVRVAKENTALARAIDWASVEFRRSIVPASDVIEAIRMFVAGYVGDVYDNSGPELYRRAYDAGVRGAKPLNA